MFKWVTVALVAQLISYLRDWTAFNTGVAVVLALALSFLLVPVLRANEWVRMVAVLLMAALSVYSLVVRHNPLVDTLGLILTLIIWRSLAEDQWPHLKRRLQHMLPASLRRFSRPVMPLPLGRLPSSARATL